MIAGSRHVPRSCTRCGAYGYCAADCTFAPWNATFDPVTLVLSEIELPRTTRFGYIRRMRRWCGFPLDPADVFFCRSPAGVAQR